MSWCGRADGIFYLARTWAGGEKEGGNGMNM